MHFFKLHARSILFSVQKSHPRLTRRGQRPRLIFPKAGELGPGPAITQPLNPKGLCKLASCRSCLEFRGGTRNEKKGSPSNPPYGAATSPHSGQQNLLWFYFGCLGKSEIFLTVDTERNPGLAMGDTIKRHCIVDLKSNVTNGTICATRTRDDR